MMPPRSPRLEGSLIVIGMQLPKRLPLLGQLIDMRALSHVPEPSARAVLESLPSVARHVLEGANSGYYAGSGSVQHVPEALGRLGSHAALNQGIAAQPCIASMVAPVPRCWTPWRCARPGAPERWRKWDGSWRAWPSSTIPKTCSWHCCSRTSVRSRSSRRANFRERPSRPTLTLADKIAAEGGHVGFRLLTRWRFPAYCCRLAGGRSPGELPKREAVLARLLEIALQVADSSGDGVPTLAGLEIARCAPTSRDLLGIDDEVLRASIAAAALRFA